MSAPFGFDDPAAPEAVAPGDAAAPGAEGAHVLPERVGREQIGELLGDAGKCHRLSNWERSFLASLGDQVREYGAATSLSAKQIVVFRRIQAKVYAT